MASTPQICVVDDAADYRLILQLVFHRFFPTYSVSLFADGNGFLEALSRLNQLPDLVVLDRHMPGLDGHQLLLRLKTHPTYRKIPVVIMSADASVQEIDDCYEACANSFLSKPTEFNLLRVQLGLICQYWLEPKTNRIGVTLGNIVSEKSLLTSLCNLTMNYTIFQQLLGYV